MVAHLYDLFHTGISLLFVSCCGSLSLYVCFIVSTRSQSDDLALVLNVAVIKRGCEC